MCRLFARKSERKPDIYLDFKGCILLAPDLHWFKREIGVRNLDWHLRPTNSFWRKLQLWLLVTRWIFK